ncbi:MAG TPA: TolC family protein [Bryobacteraceae bacterium]|nr:TolC family protein [Bryobacteraceae bacterium]
MKSFVLVLLICAAASAEVRTLTLREAVAMALAQNPDLLLARLDQQKARDQVTIVHDPFAPKIFAGSGAAYTYGYPSGLDGSAPSIIQGRAVMALINRPQKYLEAQAREGVRGAGIDTARRQEEVVYRVATLFLDVEQTARSLDAAGRRVESLTRVRDLTAQRVAEGRELPLESKKANLAVLRAAQQVEALTLDLESGETTLALALGLGAGDRVHAAPAERPPVGLPDSEQASIEQAVANSNELKSLASSIESKQLEVKSYRAAWLPKVNLVGEYAMFGRYNYSNYFRTFQRNNGELGASIEFPLLLGHSSSAQASQAEVEISKLKIESTRARERVAADTSAAYRNLKRTEAGRDVARAELDVAREELTVMLAQMDEGRVPQAAVEAARAAEDEKWLAYYDAQRAAEMARLNVLRQTGTLEAALR